MNIRVLAAALVAIALTGCAAFKDPALSRAESSGEIESGYTYIPIDPFGVEIEVKESCANNAKVAELLDALPDNAVRMLVERLDTSGHVSYLVSKLAAVDERYRVTVDYINADTINVPVSVAKKMRKSGGYGYETVPLFESAPIGFDAGTEMYEVRRLSQTSRDSSKPGEFNIPVYVGVGLRILADVNVTAGSANVSGIGVLGAEAEANRLRGSLTVQTLGVNGKSVAAALPIQNELNRTTAQNAIVAVGSIKALLYANETVKSPRVVGLYLPFPGGKPLVNALISELSRERVKWNRPCAIPGASPTT